MKLVFGLFFIISIVVEVCFAKEVVFITVLKGKILKENNSQSEALEELARGDSMEIIKMEGAWYHVNYKGKTGWIAKLFTSKSPPLKNSDINNLKKIDSDKVGRVRLNYENKGAARGLTDATTKLSRNGYEDNQKLFEGIQSIENQNFSKDDILNFQNEGKLKQ
ncbi:MAG: SH3 domain-containing protein [Deltaproteobacteria bacterium]|nr:SH3 domain-containing protein [Deltaproteobacteria bacterium]